MNKENISIISVLAICLIISFAANLTLGIYANSIQRQMEQMESEPVYAYIVGVAYEERWVRIKEDYYVLKRVPVWGAEATLGDDISYTDQCGYFSFRVRANTHELTLKKDGYYTEHRVVHVYNLEYINVEMKQKVILR